MKFLIAGGWRWPQYEAAFADALTQLDHEVVRFSFQKYFTGRLGRYLEALPVPATALWRLNRDLLRRVRASRPDVVLLWRNTHVLPSTVRRIKSLNVLTVSYNNDDPFGHSVHRLAPWHHRFLWVWYRQCLQDIDLTIVYRKVNVGEARGYGATTVYVLMPYFVPGTHKSIALSAEDEKRFACDVVFAGHYEADGREEYIGTLVDAGLHVRLFGGAYWTSGVLKRHAAYFGDVSPVHGDDYTKALCGAQLCLAFLSKMNRDSYTARCFAIPACGRVLLCERTLELETMFRDGEEAVFFSSKEELREKALWLLNNTQDVRRIAEAGRRRVYADGHDVVSRARTFVQLASDSIRAGRPRERHNSQPGVRRTQ